MFKKQKSLGKVIAGRIKKYTVWEKLPKKKLRRHPADYIICPDFKVAVTKEAIKVLHTFTIKIVSRSHPVLREALDYVTQCMQEDIIMGDKCFECCGYKESIVKIGVWTGNLTVSFKLRQLSYIEIKEIKKLGVTEEKNGY